IGNCKNLVRVGVDVVRNCKLETFDLTGCENIKYFGGNWINANVAKLDYNYKGFCNVRFKNIFPESTKIQVYDKGNLKLEFHSDDKKFRRLKILSLGYLKYLKSKGKDINPTIINIFNSIKEIDTAIKYENDIYSLIKSVSNDKNKNIVETVKLLKMLGYFGFEGEQVDKKQIEVYKNLLAKDLIYHKVIKNVKGDTNKDYINQLLQEKTNKIARSYSVQSLINAFVQNNIISNKERDKLLYEVGIFMLKENVDINFAQFFVQNFNQIMDEKIQNIDVNEKINREFNSSENANIRLYAIYYEFDRILKASNKKVVTRQNNQRLTLEDCEYKNVYSNVLEGNEKLAEYCGNAHLKQENFNALQDIFEEGKKQKYSQVLRVCNDDSESDFKYEFIEKDNPIGVVLGNITNCCQRIGQPGESCMRIGATSPFSSFVTFNYKDKIIGQAWVWYDESTKTIALDNIEVPDIYYDFINKEKIEQVKSCVKRLCDNIYNTMTQSGYDIQNIIIGAANTDMEFLDKEYYLEVDKNKCIDCHMELKGQKVYTDILKEGQYVIYKNGKQFKKEFAQEDNLNQ
ncbi:MAG: hypothetical protein ACI4TX_02175, partial [Christensenellales bacterium]